MAVNAKYWLTAVVACVLFPAHMGADTATIKTQSLSVTVNPIGKVSVPATATLTNVGTTFNSYTGSLSISYRARTASGGSITMRVTSDFAAGGPSVSSGDLSYTCGSATLGTACSGLIAASTTTSTTVLTLPPSACTGGGTPCSSSDPNLVQVNFSLANRPATVTGAYYASVQFTISTT